MFKPDPRVNKYTKEMTNKDLKEIDKFGSWVADYTIGGIRCRCFQEPELDESPYVWTKQAANSTALAIIGLRHMCVER